MKRLIPAISLAAVVAAGCGGTISEQAVFEQERELTHGPSIYADSQRAPRSPENVAVAPHTKDRAVLTQPDAAPLAGDESPLVLDEVARNMLNDIKAAAKFADGELPYEDMAKLEKPAEGILIRSREMLTVFDRRATNARILSEVLKKKEEGDTSKDAELAAQEEWVTLAKQVERSALWFNRGVQTKQPELVRKGWSALLEAGRKLPQISAGIGMLTLKRDKR